MLGTFSLQSSFFDSFEMPFVVVTARGVKQLLSHSFAPEAPASLRLPETEAEKSLLQLVEVEPWGKAEAPPPSRLSRGVMLQPRVTRSKPQVNRLGLVSSDQAVQHTIRECPCLQCM